MGDKLVSAVAKGVSIHAPSGFRAEKALARESSGRGRERIIRIMDVPRHVNSGFINPTDAASIVWFDAA